MFSIRKKFSKKAGPRRNFVRILAGHLIMQEKISTTEPRAREIRRVVEKLITIAKHKRLADLRLLLSRLPEVAAMKLYHEIGPKYTERKGGYLRIIKEAAKRKRDGAKVARIEFV